MNKTIALCYDNLYWPSVLKKCGYRLQILEQTLRTRKHAKVKPDLIVTSNADRHALIIDCKGGKNTNPDQETRYAQLDISTLRQWVSVKPSLDNHDVVYAINGNAAVRIKPHAKFSMLVFYESNLLGIGSFGTRTLDEQISQPISLTNTIEPTEHYPYGPDDKDPIIVQYVLQALVCLIRKKILDKEITNDQIVEKIFIENHRHHKLISRDAANQIKKKIKTIIQRNLLADKQIQAQLKKTHGDDTKRIPWSTLLKTCKKNLEKQSKQTRL